MLRTCLVALLACCGERHAAISSEQHAAISTERHAPPVRARDTAPVNAAEAQALDAGEAPHMHVGAGPRTHAGEAPPTHAGEAPRTLDDALAILRARGFGSSAEVIARRAAQRQPKMRLSPRDALAAANALIELADRESFRALVAVMPRSAVELSRAVRERGLSVAEADTIARYLVQVATTLAFERVAVFDENHSHVTGREWHEIDYSGENMTWQSQRDYWTPRGVRSFRTAADIHAYFVGAEKLPHWKRVYRPRGRMADVTAPAGSRRE